MTKMSAEERAAVLCAVRSNKRIPIRVKEEKEKEAEQVQSFFKWKLLLAVLLLVGYITLDFTKSTIVEFTSEDIVKIISSDVDTSKVLQYAADLGIQIE